MNNKVITAIFFSDVFKGFLKISFVFSVILIAPEFSYAVTPDYRFTGSVFLIKNKTPFPIFVKLHDSDGNWVVPFQKGKLYLLQPGQFYENRLISLKKDNQLENFASISVGQLGNARENYLIFSEMVVARERYVRSYIPDGLGSIFVDSVTNHCDKNSPEGYAYCELIVK